MKNDDLDFTEIALELQAFAVVEKVFEKFPNREEVSERFYAYYYKAKQESIDKKKFKQKLLTIAKYASVGIISIGLIYLIIKNQK